jgi:endonuclease/exonuclease/phosphatase family metal-dependent hydrolase
MKKVLITLLALAAITGTAPAQDTLRVMTYNIMGMKPGTDPATRIARAIEFIEALDPDILGLQEINETLSGGGADNQATTIADSLSSHFGIPYYTYTGYTHLSWSNQYREFIGIITKYPVTESGFLSLIPGAFPRKVIWNRINTPLGMVNFFNTHVDYVSTTVRVQEVQQIIGFIAQKDTLFPAVASILTGDFNDTPGTAPLLQLTNTGTDTFFIDTYRASNPSLAGNTVPATGPSSRIDYIWYRNTGGLAIDTSRVVMNQPYNGTFCSDHLGVMTAFTASVTGIRDGGWHEGPGKVELFQNYPNPFNPTTITRYRTPGSGHVTLKIFNVLGQAVATLVNGVVSAGSHEAVWDASGLPGGVYLLRLATDETQRTRRLLLLK